MQNNPNTTIRKPKVGIIPFNSIIPPKKYIMVTWPEIQDFMTSDRWSECIFCQSIKGHEVPDNTYMIPEDLYYKNYINKQYS